MNRAEKAQVVEGLKDKAERAVIALVTDFKGLSVEEMTGLRAKLREAGVDYQVVKNTLARLALGDGPHQVLAEMFKETNAIAFGYDDPVAAAKAISEFAKGSKKFAVRHASLEGKVLSAEEVSDLAKLPPREQLLARLLGTMNAVPTNFVSLLANVPRGLLNVLVAVRDQKEQSA